MTNPLSTHLQQQLGKEIPAKWHNLPTPQLLDKLRDDTDTAQLNTALANWYNLLPLPADTALPEPELLSDFSLTEAKRYQILPLSLEGNTLTVALSTPLTGLLAAYNLQQEHQAEQLKIYYAEPAQLLTLINQAYDRAHTQAADVVEEVEAQHGDLQSLANSLDSRDLLESSGDDAPVVRLINTILTQALKEGASDIHIEPFAKQVQVRFRCDGVMRTVITPTQQLHAAMSTRLKVMASLDIAEKRLPQDGRFRLTLAGKPTDVRVSTLPTQFGERIVLRLLGRQEGLRELAGLGLRQPQIEQLRSFFGQPNGIIFICGPTGSGKTSTLYAGLREINTPDRNIVTVEDPVEYQLDGLGQIQVNPKIGLTFAAGLRSILRQDPDVVVVGETRDKETAQIAIEAALTGHLVISTIHTNDAAGTISRLLEMGIEPFLVASALRGVIAQRMVRTLPQGAGEEYQPGLEERRWLSQLPTELQQENPTFKRAQPTSDNPNGYQGRNGIFEILNVSESIRKLITAGADDDAIRAQAQQEGMLSLFQEGLYRAAQGQTTLDEVVRVTRTDGNATANNAAETLKAAG